MKIGSVDCHNRLVLAPLAGITDWPFRRLAKNAGCGLVYTEMVSANGLVRGSSKTRRLIASDASEKPLAVQIFGDNPDVMADAAAIAAAESADILDINFGCSVKKILKTGAGANLMRTPEKAEKILTAVRNAIRIPLTIKIRSGWTPDGADAFRIAEIAAACGVDGIAVHPRTAQQGFRGAADWSLIEKIKAQSPLTIIGNGDIATPEDALEMIRTTHCDGIMIGRAAVGCPWIFTQTRSRLAGMQISIPDTTERMKIMRQYVRACIHFYGERHASFILRSHLGWFAKGMPGASRFRASITRIESEAEAIARIDLFQRKLLENKQFFETRRYRQI